MLKAKMAESSNKPVKVFRHRGVTISVFANLTKIDGDEVVFHKVSVQRTYRENDKYKSTATLSRDDIPVAILLMQRAWNFIYQTELTTSGTAETGAVAEDEE